MYGKIFEHIYDGMLAENWQALITFQQMIVLCDADGTIDMTPSALSRRTGIPLEHIEEGIKFLEKEDPYSRTPDEDGRRIMRLDEHRPWGWYIVNHEKYRKMKDADEVREQNRVRKRKQRLREAGLPDDINLKCAYCGEDATGPDHIIPRCNGGDESNENIVPCCPRCNQHKAHRSLIEFINDPFVNWIDINIIKSNQKLLEHLNCHANVTTVTQESQQSRHTDTDTDTDKTTIVETHVSTTKPNHCPYEKIKSIYHEILPDLPEVRVLSKKRMSQIKARWSSGFKLRDGTPVDSLEFWERLFNYVKDSDFLMGKIDPKTGHQRFYADLEWITKESNFIKIIEGKYH